MPEEARYLYCIVISAAEQREDLGNIGIEMQPVYTIIHEDIAAIVHRCRPMPYESKDKTQAESWIMEHSYVIDQAMKRYESILPFSINVILREGDSQIEQWLGRNYEQLRQQLEVLKGKAEFTVQIFYEYDYLKAIILAEDQELNHMQKKIEKESIGKAYLLSKKLDQMLKKRVESKSRLQSEEFLARIREQADRMIVNDRPSWIPEDFRNKRLLASYFCLVHNDNLDRLGEILDCINVLPGFGVRFSGPWAPFNFIDLQGQLS